jgi:PLP dependent protein
MNLAEAKSRLKDNLAAVEARIQTACQRAGRPRDSVLLIAVTKYVSSKFAGLLPELGVHDLGESRPQELWRKAAELPNDIRWHLIGHLQRNKIERTLPLTTLIHSIDSERLLAAIYEEAQKTQRSVNVLLEVNLSHEANKTGFEADHVPMADSSYDWRFSNVHPLGLMTMAAAAENLDQSRATFAELRELRNRIRSKAPSVRELSMGMTRDFEVAIAEGATMVRIGSALFEGVLDESAEPSHP